MNFRKAALFLFILISLSPYLPTDVFARATYPPSPVSSVLADITVKGPWVDVRAYGTLVAGVGASTAERTANTAAIQAAIDAARGSGVATYVLVPSGFVYYINSTVNLKDGVILSGTSKWYGGLATEADITMISTNSLSYTGVQNLRLLGPALGTGTAINVTASSHQTTIKDVYFQAFAYGINVNWDSTEIDNCSFYSVSFPIYLTGTAHSTTIFNPRIDTCYRGITIGAAAASQDVRVIGGTIQSASDIGINIGTYAMNVQLHGVYYEGSATADVQVTTGAINVSIYGGSSSTGAANNFYIDGQNVSLYNVSFTGNPDNYCISTDSAATNISVIDPYFSGVTASKYYSFHTNTAYTIQEFGVTRGNNLIRRATSSTGGIRSLSAEATATLSGASTVIEVNVPSGAKLLGAQLRVDTLITSGDGAATWAAAYSGGSTTALATGQAFTKNTKANKIHVDEIAASEVDITITPDAHTFSGGVVRAIVYYETSSAMADAP